MQDSCASPDLLSFEQALMTMLDSINPILDCEVVPLSMALDRVLAEPVVSPIAVPSCDNSAMDGYAFDVDSINDNDCLKLAGRSMAGRPYTEKCQFGECIRIMTGACLPRGCDTVVMQENCEVKDNHVKILAQVEKGTNIRRAGEDIAKEIWCLAKVENFQLQTLACWHLLGLPMYRFTDRSEWQFYRPETN
jgi:molybdopterin molybdotransferase